MRAEKRPVAEKKPGRAARGGRFRASFRAFSLSRAALSRRPAIAEYCQGANRPPARPACRLHVGQPAQLPGDPGSTRLSREERARHESRRGAACPPIRRRVWSGASRRAGVAELEHRRALIQGSSGSRRASLGQGATGARSGQSPRLMASWSRTSASGSSDRFRTASASSAESLRKGSLSRTAWRRTCG